MQTHTTRRDRIRSGNTFTKGLRNNSTRNILCQTHCIGAPAAIGCLRTVLSDVRLRIRGQRTGQLADEGALNVVSSFLGPVQGTLHLGSTQPRCERRCVANVVNRAAARWQRKALQRNKRKQKKETKPNRTKSNQIEPNARTWAW